MKTGMIYKFFFFLFLISHISIIAKGDRIRIERVSLEEGVSHNMVFSVMQDSKGFMWFGTMFGLIQYDGKKYTVYRHDPNNDSTLSNDDIVTMLEDKSGNLWAGSFGGGLNKFNRASGNFERYDVNFFNLENAWNGRIWALTEDKEKNIWIGTDGAGLFKLNPTSKKFKVFKKNTEDSLRSISSNYVNDILLENDGSLWLGTGKGVLNKFTEKTNAFEHYEIKLTKGLEDTKFITKITKEDDNNFWLSTDNGIVIFNKNTKKFSRPKSAELNRLNGTPINGIYKDTEGRIWVGSGVGLFLYTPTTDQLTHFAHQPNNPNSLSGNNVIAICEDNSGIMWIGNYLGGIDKIYVNKDKFETFRRIPNDPNSLSSNQVFEFMEDENGYVWIATEFGLNRFDTDLKTSVKLFHNPNNINSISHNNVRTLCLDPQGNYWIGTLNGLDKIDKDLRRIYHYKQDENDSTSLSSNRINKVFFDSFGNLWVGTDNGLNMFNPKTQKWSKYLPDQEDNKNNITAIYILSIYEDRNKDLWIGTYRGLNKFDRKTKKFIHYKQEPGNPNSISNNYVFCIYESKDGTFWVGTGGGLNKFDRKKEVFKYYSDEDGLPNEVISGIMEDENGYLYLSTHRGISKFDPRTDTFINFDVADGLQSNMFMQGAYLKRKNGEMLFGGINGFNVFDADQLVINPNQPNVYLTSIKKFDEEVHLNQDITSIKEIEFSYNDNFITFEFAALDYINPDKNQYQYMLTGINENWVDNGNINFASYTNLPPGNYKFMVKASNSDRVWSEKPLEIAIIINPPFWQTWWFFLLVVAFAVSGLFIIHGQRVKSEINKELEIKKAREQENLKVRKKAADDFHDELGHRLTKISLYSEIIKRNTKDLPPNLMSYLDKISETSSTLSFGVRDFIWTLDPEKDTLYDVLIRLKDFGDDIFDKTGIAFRVHGIEKEFETIKLSMDWRRHLTLIFKEAMNNILKYANCSNVTLSAEFNGGKIHMSITDDGKGFNFDSIKKGRGLRSMMSRAKNINGDIEVHSDNGKGTVVEFFGAFV